VQRDAIDRCEPAHRVLTVAPRGRFCPSGTFSRRERTSW
jgi:hypothetical protein